MCDTMVAVPPLGSSQPVLFAKNSDREPGEAQVVEHHLPASHEGTGPLRCTWVEVPQVSRTNEMVLSRPAWMWGAEMGANIHGLAIGNEAVFTRVPVEKSGLTGMDLLRLALERCSEAREALDLIISLVRAHGQGGRMGYRNKGFRYHSAFAIADPSEAWILETAGRFWAAKRVEGTATISNVLSIEDDFDLISDDAVSHARSRGWCAGAGDFGFARCYGDRLYRVLTGGEQRKARTLRRLGAGPGLRKMIAALRDHGERCPTAGWRMEVPCAHASWPPTRHAGQTTGSMVSSLSEEGSMHWLTGTSSPCLSVFKPVVLGLGTVETGPAPSTEGFDSDSLFWRHEVLHRRVLAGYERRREVFEEERLELESRGLGRWAMEKEAEAEIDSSADEGSDGSPAPDGPPEPKDVPGLQRPSAEAASALWEEHRGLLPEWSERVLLERGGGFRPLASAWWRRQNRLDGVPQGRAGLGVSSMP